MNAYIITSKGQLLQLIKPNHPRLSMRKLLPLPPIRNRRFPTLTNSLRLSRSLGLRSDERIQRPPKLFSPFNVFDLRVNLSLDLFEYAMSRWCLNEIEE